MVYYMTKSITEEFKDAKINAMIEDLLILEKEISNARDGIIGAIKEVPESLDSTLTAKLNNIIEASNALDKEIDDSKSEIATLKESAKHEISKHVGNAFSDVNNDLKNLTEKFSLEINNVTNTYKQEIKKSQPISTAKVFGCSIATVLLLTAVCTCAVYFVLSAQHKSELVRFGSGMNELSNFTEQTIKQLPPKQQEIANSRYHQIMSKDR